jgi:hypothetical protein
MNHPLKHRGKVWTRVLLILSAAFFATAPEAHGTVTQMTAEQIISRLAQALGGGEKLRQAENIYTRGRLELAGLTGTVEEWQSVRGQHRQSINLGDVYRNDTVFDGSRGWVRDQNGHIRDLAGSSLEDEILSAYLGSFSHLFEGRMPGSVTAGGTDPTGRYHLLQLKPQGGRAATLYLDKSTFLPARMETAKGNGTSTQHFGDWRDVDGIKLPFEVRQTENDPRNNALIKLDTARVNGTLAATTFAKPAVNARDFRFTGRQGRASIPFDLSGNIIYLRARINNSAPLWFLLDTGASSTVISARRARALGLKSEGKAASGATGGGVEVAYTKGVTFSLAGVKLLNQTVVSIPLDSFEQRVRGNFGGILGYDFISRFVVEVDYVKRVINLYDPQSYSYKGAGRRLPIVVNGTPLIRAELKVKGRERVAGMFEIDSGLDGSVVVYHPFVKAHGLLDAGLKTIETTGMGIEHEARYLSGRVEVFKVGDFSFENVIASFATEGTGAEGDTEIAGLIGGEVLRRFKVIYDYSRGEIILEPNARLGDGFEGDMSGLELAASGGRGSVLKVADVREESAGEVAGIRKGDVLVSIDGKPAASLGVEGIEKLFRQVGGEYLLTLKRLTKTYRVKLKMQSLI